MTVARGFHMDRRTLLMQALGLAAAGFGPLPALAATEQVSSFKSDPFAMLGVASGDPAPDGVVIWARLALDLADAESWGLGDRSYTIGWQVIDAEASTRPVVRSGRAVALKERGYAVHVEVDGLLPRRRYIYRFHAGSFGAEGRTLTAPSPGQPVDRLRFAFCSCAEYERERYYAYDFMAGDAPDFILHVGDYIYETSYSRRRPPAMSARQLKYDTEQPVSTLAQYRRRYAEYKADDDGWLRKAHAAAPFIATWDDHEVSNDYAGAISEYRDEKDFVARRAAAYRAYFENLPLRLSRLPVGARGGRRLHRDFAFGDLLHLFVLDTRQFRSPHACPWGSKRGGRLVSELDCPDITDTDRTMLGASQGQWLETGLSRSRQRWNVLASGVPFTALDARRERRAMAVSIGSDRNQPQFWTDSWSGYMGARQQLVDLMARNRARNPVVIAGDIHNHFVNRIFADWTKPGASQLVAPEIVTTAVSSNVFDLSEIVADNVDKDGRPGTVVWHEGKSNGYVLCDLTHEALEATMVTVKDINRDKRTARADKSVRYRIAAGEAEPRRV